ncbi:glutathione S-transferase family protein [Rheinheimera sp. MM224]|uniref:glutathione S-transferase family protein n=1 Tax=Rheinheimera sp. MM224 TaxID=3019969 RepID=UPI0021F9027F|nr:glutathione S-transferase [Rheinheimera sp. MM224]CAI3792352.1 Glutathione S-transferase GstB [Rheinheimera sp. MM224]
MLKILGKSSSINVRKVLWTCTELQLNYEQEEWGSGFQSTETDAFKALNPNALVPVLLDDDFILWESNAICRYLATQYQHQQKELLPMSARQRALVEQWMDWQSTELNNSWRYAFMHLVRKSPAYADTAAAANSIEAWNQKMHILDAALAKTAQYITGAEFTLADIVLGLSVNRWLMTPMQRPELPAVVAYYQKLSLRPGFQLFGCNGIP